MVRLAGLAGIALAAAALCSCETYPTDPRGNAESVSIPYDPYNYDPNELNDRAEAYCRAYGRHAYAEDETIDPNAVRWRYRHYRCV